MLSQLLTEFISTLVIIKLNTQQLSIKMANKTKSEKTRGSNSSQTKDVAAVTCGANKNIDNLHCGYSFDTSTGDMSGRISCESAFSSDDVDDGSSDGSTSGRSSANQESLDSNSHSIIKPIRTVIPEIEDVRSIVERARVRFLQTYESSRDKFDEVDWDEIVKPLPPITDNEQSLGFRLISRFFNFNSCLSKGVTDEDIARVCKQLADLLMFRKHYDVSNTTIEDFPKEFCQMNGLFQFGRDINNLPVVYMRARYHRRWSSKLDDLFRKYCAWQINTITKSFKDAKVGKSLEGQERVKDGSFGICFDCSSVSYSCLDLDFMRYLVKVLVDYYPTYCQYALSVDLPWLFRSIWKLVRSWLPEEAQNTVHLITARELPEFILEDQIPNCIPFSDTDANDKPVKNKHKYPANFNSLRSLCDMAKELGIGTNELKQFKSLTEKVCKDYKQLGAI